MAGDAARTWCPVCCSGPNDHVSAQTRRRGGLCGPLHSPASTATCPATVAGALTPSSGCFQNLSGNDSASALSGVTHRVRLARDNDLNGTDRGDATLLTVTGTRKEGTITVAQSVFNMYGSVSLVLKGPDSAQSTPSSFIACLVTSAASFTYVSPYSNQNNRQQDLSHISLYAGDPTPPPAVPLPATVVLLAGALGGLGALRRRKTQAA